MGNQNPEHKAKLARLSPPLAETILLPASPEQMMADTTTILPSEYSEPIIYSRQQSLQQTAVTRLPPLPPLPTVPTTKLPSMSTLTKTKPTGKLAGGRGVPSRDQKIRMKSLPLPLGSIFTGINTGNRAFIRLKDFSHLVFLLGLEWDVGGLHQPVLGPVLVDAGRFRKHLVLLVV